MNLRRRVGAVHDLHFLVAKGTQTVGIAADTVLALAQPYEYQSNSPAISIFNGAFPSSAG